MAITPGTILDVPISDETSTHKRSIQGIVVSNAAFTERGKRAVIVPITKGKADPRFQVGFDRGGEEWVAGPTELVAVQLRRCRALESVDRNVVQRIRAILRYVLELPRE